MQAKLQTFVINNAVYYKYKDLIDAFDLGTSVHGEPLAIALNEVQWLQEKYSITENDYCIPYFSSDIKNKKLYVTKVSLENDIEYLKEIYPDYNYSVSNIRILFLKKEWVDLNLEAPSIGFNGSIKALEDRVKSLELYDELDYAPTHIGGGICMPQKHDIHGGKYYALHDIIYYVLEKPYSRYFEANDESSVEQLNAVVEKLNLSFDDYTIKLRIIYISDKWCDEHIAPKHPNIRWTLAYLLFKSENQYIEITKRLDALEQKNKV